MDPMRRVRGGGFSPALPCLLVAVALSGCLSREAPPPAESEEAPGEHADKEEAASPSTSGWIPLPSLRSELRRAAEAGEGELELPGPENRSTAVRILRATNETAPVCTAPEGSRNRSNSSCVNHSWTSFEGIVVSENSSRATFYLGEWEYVTGSVSMRNWSGDIRARDPDVSGDTGPVIRWNWRPW